MDAVHQWKIAAYNLLSTENKEYEQSSTDFVQHSLTTFNDYYPSFFAKISSEPIIDNFSTLLIPTSNDITDKYFLGKLKEGDHPRNYEQKFIDEMKHKGTLLMANAATIEVGKKMIEEAEKIKTDKESDEEQWKEKLKNCKDNRNRIAEYRVMKAFYDAKNIGGILILSPKMNESLIKYLEKIRTGKHGEQSKWAETILQKYKNNDEICDFIYFHPHLGIYVIEVKASEKLDRRTAKEKSEWAAANTENQELIAKLKEDIKRLETKVRNLNTERDKARNKKHELKEAAGEETNSAVKAIEEATKQREEAKDKIDMYNKKIKIIEEKISGDKEKFLSNEYEKAVYQLDGKLKSKQENDKKSSELPETWTIMKLFYLLLTSGCSNGMSLDPAIYGIVCFPNAQLSESTRQHVESKYRHFDSDITLSTEKFEQFWNDEMTNNASKKVTNLFNDLSYRQFVSTMANCSVGRDLLGVKNSMKIAKIVNEHNFDQKTMTPLVYKILNGIDTTIFLNSTQIDALRDTSTYKFIYGAPGTGKTILVILAAMEAARATKGVGRVVVFTREWLVNYMNKIFLSNGFDKNDIVVRDFVSRIRDFELIDNDYIFSDETDTDMSSWITNAKTIANGKLFIAISGQSDISQLCTVERRLKDELADVTVDYRIIHLTEILRGTKSIIDFWVQRMNNIIMPNKFKMECGHSIKGENVVRLMYFNCDAVMEKMAEKVEELTKHNDRKNIAVLCEDAYEKNLIEDKLKERRIEFGSAAEQDDANRNIIAVEVLYNIFSREWPFVIFISLRDKEMILSSIVSLSRAIAHLTVIERNEREIRKRVRSYYNSDLESMENTLSSFEEYNSLRNEMALADNAYIIQTDLINAIIENNHLPPLINKIFPIFNDCITFDDFLYKIVNSEPWMLLLLVYKNNYLRSFRHENPSTQLTFTYINVNRWTRLVETDTLMRSQKMEDMARKGLELINSYVQPNAQKLIDQVMIKNWKLYDILEATRGQQQLDLILDSIQEFLLLCSNYVHSEQEFHINAEDIHKQIDNLLQNQKSIIGK